MMTLIFLKAAIKGFLAESTWADEILDFFLKK